MFLPIVDFDDFKAAVEGGNTKAVEEMVQAVYAAQITRNSSRTTPPGKEQRNAVTDNSDDR